MKLNFKGRREKGITLIALVITIIVLLILAGVTIATLTGDNGILKKSNDAKEETRGASVEEAVELWKINKKTEKYSEGGTSQGLQELLDDLEKQKLITEKERETINDVGQITIGSRTIQFKEKIKIGDYVNYKPKSKTYTISKTYSGYTDNQEYTTENLGWRILNINEDGTVDLISNKPTSHEVYFLGATGYNNGVYLLNDMCNNLYSNLDKGTTARSLNIEDIQDKLKSEDTYKGYESKTGTKWGSSFTYDTAKKFPAQWQNDNGVEKESENKNLIPIEKELSDVESKTITQTLWDRDAETMKTAFKETSTNFSETDSEIYYNLLCNKGNGRYWLASRFAHAPRESYAVFGLRGVREGRVGGPYLFYTSGFLPSVESRSFRPVVNIRADKIDTDTGDGTDSNVGWGIKEENSNENKS